MCVAMYTFWIAFHIVFSSMANALRRVMICEVPTIGKLWRTKLCMLLLASSN